MRPSKFRGGSAALALLALLPGAALADLTAEDVWQDWQAQARAGGQELTAGIARTGSRMALSDLTLATGTGEDRIVLTLPTMALVERGGEVAVELPAQHVITREIRIDGAPVTDRIALDHPGLSLVASGTPQDISYTFAAPLLTATVDSEADPDTDVTLELRDLGGRQRSQARGGERELTSSARMAEATAIFGAGAPDARVSGRTAVSAIEYTAHGVLPAAPGDAAALLAAIDWESQTTHGAASLALTMGDQPPIQARTSGGRSTSTLREGRAAGSTSLEAGAFEIALPGLPEPAGLGFDALTGSFALPLVRGEASEPWSFSVALDHVRANDAAWSLFDPQAVLPREPGQITLDLAGQARVTGDLQGTDWPFEVETLELRALEIALAGARLTGTGRFTFAEPGPDGLPRPVGAADLALSGGERLLDGLVALGLLPPAQAMIARMLAQGYARPGDGPDTLTSRVEFRADGSILANGRPIR